MIFIGLNQKPYFQELRECVIPFMKTSWKCIGVKLGIPNDILCAIESKNKKNSRLCAMKMFKRWLYCHVKDGSWKTLLKILLAHGEKDLVCNVLASVTMCMYMHNLASYITSNAPLYTHAPSCKMLVTFRLCIVQVQTIYIYIYSTNVYKG